ncbi:MAG: M23 family metallopeptidase [Candidatus Binataceae bacterium]
MTAAVIATGVALRLFVLGCENQLRADGNPSPAAVAQAGYYMEGGAPCRDFAESDADDSAEPAPDPIIIRFTLDHSAAVTGLLEDAGLSRNDARRWERIFENATRDDIFKNGHLITLYRDPETGDLRGFRYDLNERTAVVEQSYDNGVVLVAQRPIQYVVRPVTVDFAIRDSFDDEVARRDIPKPIVETLEDAFADRRALGDLPPGAALKLVYTEEVSRDGTHQAVGDLEAAQVRVGNRAFNAFAFRDEHGRSHLYDEHGKPLGPQVLRFPVPFEYISSGFAAERYHPILHRYRPHVGVDLVAQYGTPVKSIADGRVQYSDWAGELGKCVRIEHEHNLVSIYGHLSQISPSLKPGSYVRVGQVIGWVGSSGLSTGPHLHFALLREGRYVNPLNEKLGANHEVSPRMRALFDHIRHRYETVLARLPDLDTRNLFTGQRKPSGSRSGVLYHAGLKHSPRRAHGISRAVGPYSTAPAGGGAL